MKPKRDYDESLVTIVPRGQAEQMVPDPVADAAVPTFDNTEALRDQVKADPQHPAWKLIEAIDQAD